MPGVADALPAGGDEMSGGEHAVPGGEYPVSDVFDEVSAGDYAVPVYLHTLLGAILLVECVCAIGGGYTAMPGD